MRLFVLLIFLFIACSQEKEQTSSQDKAFSIGVEFDDPDNASQLKSKLDSVITDSLNIFESAESYFTQIGFFDSKSAAELRGFELFADSLIPRYKVFKYDSLLKRSFGNFYFTGWYLDRPSLYKINLFSKKIDLVWSKWGRKIVKLDRSENGKIIYFPTVLVSGFKAGFPFVTNLRLYHFDLDDNEVSFIRKFGNGLGVNSVWEDDSTYALYFTVLDSLTTSTIIQKKYQFDEDGNLSDQSEKIFELMTDGIQFPNLIGLNPVSPNLSYKFTLEREDTTGIIKLENRLNGEIFDICSTYTRINFSAWTEDEQYLFITTGSETNHSLTHLLVIKTNGQILERRFTGEGEKNFVIHGNLLIFDNGFGRNSEIYIYRFREDKMYHGIALNGGCGVNGIPNKPGDI